jgi:signal transduction protein with GAF and PtsI domain
MLFISIHEVVEHRQRQLELDYNDPIFVKGISGTDGIAKGKTIRLDQNSYDVLTAIDDDEDCTIETFETAIKKTEAQLSQLQRETEKELSDVASLIFSAHLLMLMDDAFTGEMRDKINNGISPSRAVVKVVNQYIELFSSSENQRLAEKVQDLKDLGHRMLYNLSHQEEDVADYHGQILIAEELLPSDILKLATQNVEGLIIMQGGGTAHISILATSLEIPLVFSDDPQLSYLLDDTPIIMDASQGTIFIRPNKKVIEQYDKIIADQASLEELAKQVRPETFTRAVTRMPAGSFMGSKSTVTWESASGWHSGMSSWVRLAAMIPASRAVARTSPFLASPSSMRLSVSLCMETKPSATAIRSVTSLSATSTICASPRSFRWVRVF